MVMAPTLRQLRDIIRPRFGDGTPPSMFNLRLWFGVTAFAIIAAMGVAFGIMLSRFINDSMLERDAVVTRDFLESIIRAERSTDAVFVGTPQVNPHLTSFTQHIMTIPDVLRANLYARGGLILWSTDAALIGRTFQDNHELDAAFRGELVTEIGTLAEDAKSEHVNLTVTGGQRFIEAYMPIRDSLGRVLAVVELYKVPSALNATIHDGQVMIWSLVLSGMLLLFLSLFWIVRRGARLIERQQAELGRMEALAALGQMASAIAHSMRNPLSGIRGSAELLRLEHEDAGEAADDIIGQVDRMDLYVRDLLDYARAKDQAPQRVDPSDVLQATLSRLRPILTQQQVAVSLRDERPAPSVVLVDPQLLSQALGNVVTNAIEAMGPGGSLVLELARAGNFVNVTVTDSGPGIPAEVRAHVTEAFFTTKTRGLGLGLALARQIVERFGGRLDIPPPREGGGATIRLSLPMARQA